MPPPKSTHVAIIGAGPAGLTLANLLARRGAACVVFDKFTTDQIVTRARAGLLEYRTVELFEQLGVADRLLSEGHRHAECEFRYDGESFRLELAPATQQRSNYVYPQQEIVRDLLEHFQHNGGDVQLGQTVTGLDLDGSRPILRLADGASFEADFVVGADGNYSVVRAELPDGLMIERSMQHEFRWLTLLAKAAPSSDCTIYAAHDDGFAGHLLRSSAVTRFHLQVPFDDSVDDWPDDRIWQALRTRLALPGFILNEGEIFSKNMLEMRSRVSEPMRFGRAFLAGDAAHIITPAGGKGMNLAIADAVELDEVIAEFDRSEDDAVLDEYSRRRLPDIWNAQEFSHELLHMLHTYANDSPFPDFHRELQKSRLRRLQSSAPEAKRFAERYIGPDLRKPHA